MEFVSVGAWADLRPGLNVLSVVTDSDRSELVRSFESIFSTGAANVDAPAVTIAGAQLVLDQGLRRTLFENLGGVSPIVTARTASRSLHPSAVSIESALQVIRALSDPHSSPREAPVEVFRRMTALQEENAHIANATENSTKGDLASARRDVAALRRWIEELADGFRRIDEAQVAAKALEAAAYKKFAGPTAFNKLLDAQAARDEIVTAVGFESYEVYMAEKGAVMSDASKRLDSHQRMLNELESVGLDKRERTFRPSTAEMEFLAAHVNFEERYGNDPGRSLAEQSRTRTVLRQGFRHQLALFLDSLGIGGNGEVDVVAEKFLESQRIQGETMAASRMELLIKGRIEALTKVTAFAPVPCILDDVFSGWPEAAAHQTFSQLIETAKGGHQILYVCTRAEAARVSPLVQLFQRAQHVA
jgi:hypothetical protein